MRTERGCWIVCAVALLALLVACGDDDTGTAGIIRAKDAGTADSAGR